MFGKVPDDSFQNIFDLSFDSEDSKCIIGSNSKGLDFFGTLSPPLNNNNNNVNFKNKNNIDNDFLESKSWKNAFSNSPTTLDQDELENAIAKLYARQPSMSAQDAFASSVFPFSISSAVTSTDRSKGSDLMDNTSYAQKKLLATALLMTAGSSSSSSASSTCSTSSSASSAIACPSANTTAAGSLPATKVNPSRYKTELCRPYQENGSCKYGDKCQFAHGFQELRTVNRHPKYKTDLCRTYHSVGFCPYGPRCHFIHSLDEIAPPPKSSMGTSTPTSPTSNGASATEIAAAIAALRQLPMFTPERVSAPPGFESTRPRRPLEGLGLSSISNSTSGISSASSLSPSLLTEQEDGNLDSLLPRLPVFSRLFH